MTSFPMRSGGVRRRKQLSHRSVCSSLSLSLSLSLSFVFPHAFILISDFFLNISYVCVCIYIYIYIYMHIQVCVYVFLYSLRDRVAEKVSGSGPYRVTQVTDTANAPRVFSHQSSAELAAFCNSLPHFPLPCAPVATSHVPPPTSSNAWETQTHRDTHTHTRRCILQLVWDHVLIHCLH